MDVVPLTGAQRSYLRGLGQRLEAAIKLGRDGLTPPTLAEVDRALHGSELIKVRYDHPDRRERAATWDRLAEQLRCECVGSVGHTALFYRRNPEEPSARIELPT